jgi:hypothetical protein
MSSKCRVSAAGKAIMDARLAASARGATRTLLQGAERKGKHADE